MNWLPPGSPHRVACAYASAEVAASLLAPKSADLVVVDPPWGPGITHVFDMKAGRAYQDWRECLNGICAAIAFGARGPVVVYMGHRWADETVACLAQHGLTLVSHAVAKYTAKLDAAVLQFTPTGVAASPVPWTGARWGVPWYTEAAQALGVPAGALLFDPCLGLGLSSRAAKLHGWRLAGIEPDPARLARAVKALGKGVS